MRMEAQVQILPGWLLKSAVGPKGMSSQPQRPHGSAALRTFGVQSTLKASECHYDGSISVIWTPTPAAHILFIYIDFIFYCGKLFIVCCNGVDNIIKIINTTPRRKLVWQPIWLPFLFQGC